MLLMAMLVTISAGPALVVGHRSHVQNRLLEAKTDSIIEMTSVLEVKKTCGAYNMYLLHSKSHAFILQSQLKPMLWSCGLCAAVGSFYVKLRFHSISVRWDVGCRI